MSALQEKATSPMVFVLPALMTIETVESLAEEFRGRQWSGAELTLDASLVEVVTTPGLQLLISLAKTLGDQGAGLSIREASPAFEEAARDVGISGSLPLQQGEK